MCAVRQTGNCGDFQFQSALGAKTLELKIFWGFFMPLFDRIAKADWTGNGVEQSLPMWGLRPPGGREMPSKKQIQFKIN